MEQSAEFESSNINSKWLDNIYENLKNLEAMERIARQGCENLMEYLQIPQQDREKIIALTQYKNLSFIITEIGLLLTDVGPVFKDKDKLKKYRNEIADLEEKIKDESLFLNKPYSAKTQMIIRIELTPLFYKVLDLTTNIKRSIIDMISHLLYVEADDRWKN